jgi:Glycosyl transferase family 2/Galactosyltransferase/Galactoside-binding lectin
MLIFFADRPARFSCQADFCEVPYANLSFFAADAQTIPFHLSLRAQDGLIVCNRRGPDPDDWGQEIRRPLALNGPVRLSLHFDAPRLRIAVNGQWLFRFGSWLRRNRFPGLSGIRYVDITGAIPAASLDLDIAPGDDEKQALYLDPRLELRGTLPGTQANLNLDNGPGTPTLPLVTDAAGPDTTLRAGLPGHLWRDLPAKAPLHLRLRAGNRPPETLEISRDDLCHRISLLAGLDLSRDPATLARVVEHLRFGDLLTRLAPAQHSALLSQAQAAGLGDFLGAGTAPGSEADLPDPASEAPEHALRAALARVADALTQPDPDPETLRSALIPPTGQAATFFVHLAESFCLRGRFDLLEQQARVHGLGQVTPGDDAWFNSGLLPFALSAGHTQTVLDILSRLAADTRPWIMTPPLAWSLSQSLHQAGLSDKERLAIIDAGLCVVEAQADSYWGRSPCTELTGAALDLVAARPQFSPAEADRFDARVLRIYGLSRDFWQQAARRDLALAPALAGARAGFATLANPQAGAGAQESALALFQSLGCPDADRVRRDLLGPAGVTSPTLQTLTRAGLDPGQAALRHMASPDSTPVARDLAEAARAAMPDACRTFIPIARSPFAADQERAARSAMSLLEAARQGRDPVHDLPALLDQITPLCCAEAGWIGHILSQGLLRGLRTAGASQSAELLQKHLATRATVEPDRLPRPVPGLPAANPLFDTLVTVFSCRANLESRIPALRAAWLDRLAGLGVPYVIITGGGDDTLRGDILHLDAPDDYEGLPQKTLATVAWVHAHTPYAHMLKIDDDCFLNADLFFHSLSYRKFDYYGRTLSRITGQMDRAWHCAKSSSRRGRLELDKSPEPSTYCDGGSGYALSRKAMGAALTAAASPQGQALIWSSFMEDKLLGDLLALQAIRPENEDYDVTLRRRARPGGIPVPRWLNGFDASRTAPVKLVHLDDETAQICQQQSLNQRDLTPKKIWPTFQPAWLGEASNALEMISPLSRLDAARAAPVAVVAALRNEVVMLPHFLAHYRRLGVDSFLVADNGSDDGTLEYLAEQPDVALFSVDTAYNASHYGVAWQQALIANFRPQRWSLLADADELLVWEDRPRTTLPALLEDPGFAEADAVRVFMLDLYPRGPLEQADFTSGDPFALAGFCDRVPFLQTSLGRGPYSNSPTWTSAVRHRLIAGSRPELFVAQKLALLKYTPWMRLSDGLHYAAGLRLAKCELLFGHFKYTAQFHAKARAEVARRQHFNDAEEYRSYLALLSEGRDVIYDPAISVPWREAPFVRARLR